MKISSLAFLIGVGSLFLLPQLPNLYIIGGVVLLGLVAAFLTRFGIFVLVAILGFSYTWCQVNYALETRLPEKYSGKYIELTGTVLDITKLSQERTKFILKVTQTNFGNETINIKKVNLNWYRSAPKLQYGQILKLTAKLTTPHGMFNNSGFDYELYLLANGFDATGYVVNKLPFAINTQEQNISNKFNNFKDSTKVNYLANAKTKPLLTALLLGDRSEMTDEHWEVLRKTGTNHLLAISGLHLGLVGVMCLLGLRLIFIRFGNSFLVLNSLNIATFFAIMTTLLYATLAGFSVPTQRAFIMLSVAGVALLMNRQVSRSQIFCLAILMCIIFEPFYVVSAGFWLSFSAVFWILVMPKTKHKILFLVTLQLVLGIGLIPVLSLFGFGVSLVSLPANLIALPVISFITLPSLLLGFLFSYFDFSFILLNFADLSLNLLWQYLTYCANFSNVWQRMPQPSIFQALVASIGFLILILPRHFPMKMLGVLMFAVVFVPYSNNLKVNQAKITVLDVGQGLSILLETKNHNLLFDVGRKYFKATSIYKTIIEQFLANKQIKTIDKLIISHADNDHSGGFSDVVDNLKINHILSSTPQKFPNAKLCIPQTWQWDNVQFTILHPAKNSKFKGNNNSCVLLIKAGNKSMLILSDIEAKAEKVLINTYPNLTSDIILAPHHGSKTSSGKLLLASIKPKIAIISSGYKNQFKHPHKTVIERFKSHNIQTFNTSLSGAVEVFLNDKIVITQYREKYGKFWHKAN